MTRAGFPHSDILGSRFVCQLPEAYRRLQRPSSAPSAKASTLCPYKLDHNNSFKKDARVHCAVLKLRPEQAPSPQRLPTPQHLHADAWVVRLSGTSPQPPEPHHHPQAATRLVATLTKQPFGCSLRTQQRAQPTPPQQRIRSHPETRRPWRTRSPPARKPATVDVPPSSTVPHSFGRDNGPGHPPPPMTGACGCQMLLRKEVIQPHLPVRLPCYDLVPIASPTFDSSPSYELGHWLRVLPTFVT